MPRNRLTDKDLERMLTGACTEERIVYKNENLVPKTIKISPNIKKKALLLGPLVEEVGGRPYEWYGFLLAYATDPDYVIRDIILARDQHVIIDPKLRVRVEETKASKTLLEIRKRNEERGTNYHVVGWIHNHGNLGVGHSPIDDVNILRVFNTVWLNTKIATHLPLKLIKSQPQQTIEDSRVVMRGDNLDDAVLEYNLPEPEKIEAILKRYGVNVPEDADKASIARGIFNDLMLASELKVKEPAKIAFCYSVVVNNKGVEPYGEVAILKRGIISNEERLYGKKISLEVVDVENDIEVVRQDLVDEINATIIFPN